MVDSEKLGVSFRRLTKALKKNAKDFDTIFLNETIETAKNKLKIIKDEGSDTRGVFRSFFYFFSIDQTPNCPKFVEWCANNYSAAEEVIMDEPNYRILFPIHASIIRKSLFCSNFFVHLS